MKYSKVYIDAIGYELPPVVVTTAELEARLGALYDALRIPQGQLQALTGISERRWWDEGYSLSDGAIAAGRHALDNCDVRAKDLDVLIYAGVCREMFEPATACKVAAGLSVGPDTAVYDLSNACLGVLNGMVDVANRIELGQARAGLVVSCETSREINDIMIERMLQTRSMEMFRTSLATLTGGSGAVAVLLTDGSFSNPNRRRLMGGATQAAPQHHSLCRWGIEQVVAPLAARGIETLKPMATRGYETMMPIAALGYGAVMPIAARTLETVMPLAARQFSQYMTTDSVAVLKHGVELGQRTWARLMGRLDWHKEWVDKVICHQVGSGHRETVLKTLGIDASKDFSTYEYLGNIGTVSLPLTAALAEEREFLRPGDKVGFLGIGSGLNCMMLGLEW
jgi:3-oxoacyl-[acyl-carrier-protein] synthase III